MTEHTIVNDEDWLTARRELLVTGKEFSKNRDEKNLPFPMAWVNFHDKY